jgi:hypothetical protein
MQERLLISEKNISEKKTYVCTRFFKLASRETTPALWKLESIIPN